VAEEMLLIGDMFDEMKCLKKIYSFFKVSSKDNINNNTNNNNELNKVDSTLK
jgi:hypothetical protein